MMIRSEFRVYVVLSKFPNIRRNLARYGYYEKEGKITI
jgi:hypothetical protein